MKQCRTPSYEYIPRKEAAFDEVEIWRVTHTACQFFPNQISRHHTLHTYTLVFGKITGRLGEL